MLAALTTEFILSLPQVCLSPLSKPDELLRQSHSRRIVNIQVRTPGVARRVAYVQAVSRLIKYPWCNWSD